MNRFTFAVITFSFLFVPLPGCTKSGSGPTAPNDTPGAPTNVTESEPNDVSPQPLGVLGSSEITVSGTATNEKDLDRFSLTLSGTTNLVVRVSWQGGTDLDLGIKNGGGIPITFRDTGGNPESCTLPSTPPGPYILEVTTKQSSSTSYTLTVGKR